MQDITMYMNDSIEHLIANALRLSGQNPRQLLFLARYNASHQRACIKRRKLEENGVHVPPFLIASVAKDCNLSCTGCYAAVNQACAAQGTQLPAKRWEEIFSQARELGISFILIAGGEPLMRPDVIRVAAKNKDIIFPVFTNGTLIDDKWTALFNKNRNLVPILSIEGDRETTDGRRGAGVYDKLCIAMEKLKKKKIFYGVSITVTKNNIGQVTNTPFISFLEQNGCSIAFYVEYVPADENTRDIVPSDSDREFLARRLEEIREEKQMLAIAFPGDEKQLGGCLAAGRGFFHINASGGAEPCPFSPFSDISLKDHSLLEALDSPLFKKLQSSEILQSEHDGGCVLFEHSGAVEQMLTR